MLYNLFPSDLPCGEIFRGNIALRKSDKSANCHAATELQGKKTDMRMKPDWLNDNPMVELVKLSRQIVGLSEELKEWAAKHAVTETGLENDKNQG